MFRRTYETKAILTPRDLSVADDFETKTAGQIQVLDNRPLTADASDDPLGAVLDRMTAKLRRISAMAKAS